MKMKTTLSHPVYHRTKDLVQNQHLHGYKNLKNKQTIYSTLHYAHTTTLLLQFVSFESRN